MDHSARLDGARTLVAARTALAAGRNVAMVSKECVPCYTVQGCRLTKDVAAGALLTRDALEPPADSALWRLREEQDARFFA